jgi:hypothetical protein
MTFPIVLGSSFSDDGNPVTALTGRLVAYSWPDGAVDPGDSVELAAQAQDSAGVPGPADSVTATVTVDGVSTPLTVVYDGQGVYRTAVTISARSVFAFSGSGGVLGTPQTFVDVVEIVDSSALLFSVADGKLQLNIPATDTRDDDEIRGYIAAITPVIEDHIGACVRRTVVEYHQGNTSVIRLDAGPVLEVMSMTPYLTAGTTYAPAVLRVTAEGRLTLLSGLPFSWGPYEITYTVGRATIPANAVLAGKMILQHLWESQRAAAGVPLGGADETTMVPGFGFAVPNRALELLSPDDLGPAIG